MANWVATHTDRFKGIVTHASLWALDQFGPTTDGYHYWRREMSAAMVAANSPNLFAEHITTEVLKAAEQGTWPDKLWDAMEEAAKTIA